MDKAVVVPEPMLGFVSGLVAGVVGVVTGYPFDTLKVRQSHEHSKRLNHRRIFSSSKGEDLPPGHQPNV
jgi:hypothetical protein